MAGSADEGWAGGGHPPHPGMMRISDSERHAVAEVLREAAGEGRIDLAELDERLEAAYAAKTYADLVPLTADLPVGHLPATQRPAHPLPPPVGSNLRSYPMAPGGPTPAVTYPVSIAVMSETRRSGVWRVEDSVSAFAFMGSVVLDLRRVQFSRAETHVNASAVMGGVEIIVGPEVQVVVEGVGVMGEYAESRSKVPSEVGPGSPVVRVRGLALMGSVSVKRKAPGDRPRR